MRALITLCGERALSVDGRAHIGALLQPPKNRKVMKMKLISRILLICASLALASTYYLPLWEITLDAPQYPEGLGIEIWINQVQGSNPNDLNKINNLNHYIGMKKIEPESIPELKVMPWVMRGLLVLGIVVGLVGKRKLLLAWLITFALVSAVGFYDYYKWGHDYGTNLDTEHAIIKVPGMSYQPPLIGSKNLLNFKATSLPGSGGWIAVGSFCLAGLIWVYEARRQRKQKNQMKRVSTSAIAMALFSVLILGSACANKGPVEIHYGDDQCDYCRMNITHKSFGSQLVSSKGKAFKFDSIECLAAYTINAEAGAVTDATIWVADFNNPGTFIQASASAIVLSEQQSSPMGLGIVGFSTVSDATTFAEQKGGRIVSWSETQEFVRTAWSL